VGVSVIIVGFAVTVTVGSIVGIGVGVGVPMGSSIQPTKTDDKRISIIVNIIVNILCISFIPPYSRMALLINNIIVLFSDCRV